MDLIILHNDPTQTLLTTPDGTTRYTVHTTTAAIPSAKATTISRHEHARGHVLSEIARIVHGGPHTRLLLSPASIGGPSRTELELVVARSAGPADSLNSWTFTGPDKTPYTWQLFIRYPVLTLAAPSPSQPPTILARYRRAKLGIVSRPRRAFLEIFPAGLAIVDLVVVTFVSFVAHRAVGPETGLDEYLHCTG